MKRTLLFITTAAAIVASLSACGDSDDDSDTAAGLPSSYAGPFDRAFIDAMVPHHRNAIEMAEAAKRPRSDSAGASEDLERHHRVTAAGDRMSVRARLNRVATELRNGADLFRASISKRGLVRTLGLIPSLGWRKASVYVADVSFDRAHGVQTRGVVKHPPRQHGFAGALPYQPTPPRRFREILDSLEIRYSDFTFVDVGCGKGRALILASEFPFRRIVGVELSETLANTARTNIAAFRAQLERPPTFEVVTGDAASYTFPSEPCVVFLFNPFLEETMDALLENLDSSLREKPRELLVVYLKPVLRSALGNAGFLTAVEATPDHAVWRAHLPEEAA